MIIQVRGTSGSGKSTVVRTVMKSLGGLRSVYVSGRKRPLYYTDPSVAVLGHYESPCGGCDTIGSARMVWELVSKVRREVPHIICEGLLLSEDVKWSLNTPGLVVYFLVTQLETCLARVEARRTAAGNFKPLNPENTSRRVAVIDRARVKLEAAGVEVRRCSPEQTVRLILQRLRLHAQQRG